MSLTDMPYPHAAENDVIVRVQAAGFTPVIGAVRPLSEAPAAFAPGQGAPNGGDSGRFPARPAWMGSGGMPGIREPLARLTAGLASHPGWARWPTESDLPWLGPGSR